MRRNLPNKNFNSNYIRFNGKTAFRIDFGPREVPKLEKKKTAPALSPACVFWLGHFSRSKIDSESSFKIKSYIITFEIFVLERSVSKNGLKIFLFPIVFSKCDLTRVGSFFLQQNKSEKAKHSKICLSFSSNMPEAQI